MNLTYQVLFVVEVLNDFFTDLKCEDLEIVPTRETLGVLGHNMIFKSVGNKAIVLVKTDAGKPVVAMAPTARLSFYVGINNVAFSNYTNINYHPFVNAKYYFANLNQTFVSPAHYLSAAISNYSGGNNYAVGALADNGSGDIFEAIKSSTSGSPKAVTDPAYWLPRGKVQYVNGNDNLPLNGDIYLFPSVAAANDFTIKIFGLNTVTNAYDVLVNTTTQHFDTASVPAPIDLSRLAPYGKYRIDINGASDTIYYDNFAVSQNVLGFIEIFNNLDAANEFSLFDGAGLPKKKTFTLRFANRCAIWKYIARTNDVTAIKDNSSAYTFGSIPATTAFSSSVPIPFRQQPLNTIYLESTLLGHITPVANPGTDRLSTIMQGGDTYYCTEKHLNY